MQRTRIDRREFIKLAGLGGAVVVAGCAGMRGAASASSADDFHFVQLSDTHWGFDDPRINPDATGTLPKAVAAVNSLRQPPDSRSMACGPGSSRSRRRSGSRRGCCAGAP